MEQEASVISKRLLMDLMNYLDTKPHSEVRGFIDMLVEEETRYTAEVRGRITSLEARVAELEGIE
jgi:hypothetical protein